LKEAVSYNTGVTFDALERLKKVYLELGDIQEYENVLETQTARTDCTVGVYDEFARYYMAQNKIVDALKVLKTGIARTNDTALAEYYEEHRYAFDTSRQAYDDVTAYHSGGIQVKMGGLWGLANSSGKLIIPCDYEQLSSYDTANGGCVIARKTGEKITALNAANQAVAILDSDIKQIGNLSQNIVPLRLANGKWIIADSKLVSNNKEYEDIGTVFNSAVAVKSSGNWGVISLDGENILPYEYDEIITDELGRCYAQNAVFAKRDGIVYLFVDGEALTETYEDARPFTDDGWAAVKKNGKWGFIDTSGEVRIDYQFEDALSFSQDLAPVQLNQQLWGYINTSGKEAIEPQFLKAKRFSKGKAPVLTELGWQFISFLEYEEGAGL
jgi:hypothetical protein